jgi:hypothetical protein
MNERLTRLIRNGVCIPATLIGEDHNQVVEPGSVPLYRSPSMKADIVDIDAQAAELKVEGSPRGGFQKVVVIDGNGRRIFYQATE